MKTILIIVGLSFFASSSFARMVSKTNVSIDAYDGMIHLELTGKAAKTYFEAIKSSGLDNGAVITKDLKDNISCSYFKSSNNYICTLSNQDGSDD